MAPTSNGGTAASRALWNFVIVVAAVVAFVMFVSGNSPASRSSVAPAVPRVQAPAATAPDTKSKCPEESPSPIHSAPDSKKAAKTVALTFDDGPGPGTGTILNILRDHDVRATFFVVGEMVAARPEVVRRIKAAGHAIGNHTWSHPIPKSKVGWKSKVLARQIAKTQSAIGDAVGDEPCYFRPPGGIVKGARRPTRSEHLSMVLWSVDTRDWSKASASTIRKRARVGLEQRHPVILLHDGGSARSHTAKALPGIIADYKAHGYKFVTFSGTQQST